ncbi:tol-pal system protein YbgF [Agrobacterium sp. a22-2]|uniref:tol-pal system protein YbgF n=1 Tax=Agrobacterium sp. a22-2 TaxID=2283840 RepID=UPI0014480859|nr:tol-pal system protein YbgF [Agrobacterium sp. a22-2]NKN35566.1 tol-pal system protein YbgF [Agrobacterium sp. a22-2]
MKKLVMAGMLGLAAFVGLHGSASSLPLLPMDGAPKASARAQAGQPVQLVQLADPAVRVQQLEEEIRALNGRIEEMSFQILQMQEQMRKTQEDNEFRFQELEKSETGATRPRDTPVARNVTPDQGSSVTDIITQSQDTAVSRDTGAGQAPPETVLGSIELDANGMPRAATLNGEAGANASLPGVETTNAPKVASLDREADVYQVAYGHVLSGDYGLAETEFNDFLARYPKSAKAADANFWLGEAQYSQGDFGNAAKTFLNAHQAYGKSAKAPEMLLKLGMSLAALDNKDTACATLREVSKRYPSASRAVLGKATSEQKRLAC